MAKTFSIAGDGDDWSVNGREVVSGAGKGKDDPLKMYQLGGEINRFKGGEQGVNIHPRPATRTSTKH